MESDHHTPVYVSQIGVANWNSLQTQEWECPYPDHSDHFSTGWGCHVRGIYVSGQRYCTDSPSPPPGRGRRRARNRRPPADPRLGGGGARRGGSGRDHEAVHPGAYRRGSGAGLPTEGLRLLGRVLSPRLAAHGCSGDLICLYFEGIANHFSLFPSPDITSMAPFLPSFVLRSLRLSVASSLAPSTVLYFRLPSSVSSCASEGQDVPRRLWPTAGQICPRNNQGGAMQTRSCSVMPSRCLPTNGQRQALAGT